jgi:hypothetical protein
MTAQTMAAKKAAKRARRPVYATIRPVADLETGEERLGILAMHPIDRRLLTDRGYRTGDELRLEIKRKRNVGFHRLFHVIGNLLVDNVEGFEHLSSHDAVKRVQTKAGVCCDVQMVDMGTIKFGDVSVPVGEVPVNVARSMAFDEMDEDEAGLLFNGITGYIGEHYAQVMLDEVRAEFWLMVNREAA